GCSETINLEKIGEIQPAEIQVGAPRIFSVKLQLGNGTKILSSESNQFVSHQSMSVYAIVDSASKLDHVELRFAKMGESSAKYVAVKMDLVPLQISNTTYAVSGTIPQEMMQAPAMTYWIDVHNKDGKTSDSDQYTIGAKPNYVVDGKLEMDLRPTRAEST